MKFVMIFLVITGHLFNMIKPVCFINYGKCTCAVIVYQHDNAGDDLSNIPNLYYTN